MLYYIRRRAIASVGLLVDKGDGETKFTMATKTSLACDLVPFIDRAVLLDDISKIYCHVPDLVTANQILVQYGKVDLVIGRTLAQREGEGLLNQKEPCISNLFQNPP